MAVDAEMLAVARKLKPALARCGPKATRPDGTTVPTVAAPMYKQVYDLGTGECFTDPSLFLQTFRTRIVGGFIEVEVTA